MTICPPFVLSAALRLKCSCTSEGQHLHLRALRRTDMVLGLTNHLLPQGATDSGGGTDCEVEDIEHSEESEEEGV
jgi:hypothetical protein